MRNLSKLVVGVRTQLKRQDGVVLFLTKLPRGWFEFSSKYEFEVHGEAPIISSLSVVFQRVPVEESPTEMSISLTVNRSEFKQAYLYVRQFVTTWNELNPVSIRNFSLADKVFRKLKTSLKAHPLLTIFGYPASTVAVTAMFMKFPMFVRMWRNILSLHNPFEGLSAYFHPIGNLEEYRSDYKYDAAFGAHQQRFYTKLSMQGIAYLTRLILSTLKAYPKNSNSTTRPRTARGIDRENIVVPVALALNEEYVRLTGNQGLLSKHDNDTAIIVNRDSNCQYTEFTMEAAVDFHMINFELFRRFLASHQIHVQQMWNNICAKVDSCRTDGSGNISPQELTNLKSDFNQKLSEPCNIQLEENGTWRITPNSGGNIDNGTQEIIKRGVLNYLGTVFYQKLGSRISPRFEKQSLESFNPITCRDVELKRISTIIDDVWKNIYDGTFNFVPLLVSRDLVVEEPEGGGVIGMRPLIGMRPPDLQSAVAPARPHAVMLLK